MKKHSFWRCFLGVHYWTVLDIKAGVRPDHIAGKCDRCGKVDTWLIGEEPHGLI